LNLYRYTPNTSDELIKILEEVSDRIWLTHQSAFEYHKNRLTIIHQQADIYEEIKQKLADHQNKIKDEIQALVEKRRRHPYINPDLFYTC
jgi:hypothetical protein